MAMISAHFRHRLRNICTEHCFAKKFCQIIFRQIFFGASFPNTATQCNPPGGLINIPAKRRGQCHLKICSWKTATRLQKALSLVLFNENIGNGGDLLFWPSIGTVHLHRALNETLLRKPWRPHFN